MTSCEVLRSSKVLERTETGRRSTLWACLMSNVGSDCFPNTGRLTAPLCHTVNRVVILVLVTAFASGCLSSGHGQRDRVIDYLALYYAAQGENELLVEALLARGSPVDAPGIDTAGMLSAQAVEFDSPLQAAAKQGNVKIVSMLLRHHPWVDHRCCDGPSALGYAAAGGYLEVVRLLVQAGADPSIESEQGTALEAARHNGHAEVVQYLEGLRHQ